MHPPLESLRNELPEGVLVTDPDILASYRHDRAMDPAAGTPLAVVRPTTTEEVQAVLRWAGAHRIPVVPRGAGKIITICSVQSELGRPTIAPYAASKGALRMLTRTLCAEWAKHGVNVNGVAPGYYATELTSALVQNAEFSDWLCKRVPAGRWGKVEELVGATVFLAAPASDFVHGHLLYVDGGMTAVV